MQRLSNYVRLAPVATSDNYIIMKTAKTAKTECDSSTSREEQ